MTDAIARFQGLLEAGQDSAMLRLALANALLGAQRPEEAITHLRAAVAQDAEYSAAWKLLIKTVLGQGEYQEVLQLCESGLAVARAKKDMQAVKEMEVYAKRAQRQLDAGAGRD